MAASISINDLIKEVKKISDVEVRGLTEERPKIFTGDAFLDLFYGGGIFHPGFVYLWGGEGSSKSTYAAQIALRFKKMNPSIIILLDTEESYDRKRWLNLGWDEKSLENSLLVLEPDYIEAIRGILNTVWEKTEGKIPVLVIWDSVSSTPSKEEYIDEMDRIGLISRALSKELRNWKIAKYNTTFITISQFRENIGNPYAGHEPPGGRALRHKSDLTLLLSASKPDEKIIDPKAARKIKIKIQKSRLVSPGNEFEYIATNSRGFNAIFTLIHHLFELKLLDKPKGKRKYKFTITNEEYTPIEFIKQILTSENAYDIYFKPVFQKIINSYPEDDRPYLQEKLDTLIKNEYFDKKGKVKLEAWTTIPASIAEIKAGKKEKLDTLETSEEVKENE